MTNAVAEVLDAHQAALVLSDINSQRERDVYRELVDAHRLAAAQLAATAARMAGYRDLPMGAHDMTVMRSSENTNAFARLVAVQEELLALLRARVDEHRAMLNEMDASGGAN